MSEHRIYQFARIHRLPLPCTEVGADLGALSSRPSHLMVGCPLCPATTYRRVGTRARDRVPRSRTLLDWSVQELGEKLVL